MSIAESSSAGGGGAPVRNALTIFAAHFHVRRGNEVLWSKGLHSTAELSQQGLEWKVLPSGSHLLERDVLFFDVAQTDAGRQERHGHMVGVAAFRNRKIAESERTSAEGVGDGDQRGARMIAVGVIVDCGAQRTPWTQLAATLPHICHLETLADALAADPTCRNLLEEWLEVHQRKSDFVSIQSRDLTAEGPFYPHDPLLMLPAVSNALGPLLPGILKRLLAAPFRLLIFAPHGASAIQAASIAFNLGELVHAACQSPSSDRVCPVSEQSSNGLGHSHGLDVIGTVGLHDIDKLQAAAKQWLTHSWIAWTSDRILLDKPSLYNAVLDLSPMMPSQDNSMIDSTVLPRLFRSERTLSSQGRETFTLRKQTWTTREFAVYRGLDERANLDATSARQARRAVERRRSQSSLQTATTSQLDERTVAARRPTSAHPSTSTLLAFITFWLSSLRILPQRWRLNLRESYGYVPLSIRSDGGIRASIMLLPSDEEDELDDDDDDDSGDSTGNHLSVPSTSPRMKRRSLDGIGAAADEREDYLEDPILAAVGAGTIASRRRHSRSLASKHSAARLASDVASSHGDTRPASPEMPMHSADAIAQQEQKQVLRDAREGVRLALCIFVSWSEWIDDLVEGVQDLVQEKVSGTGGGVDQNEGTTRDDGSQDEDRTAVKGSAGGKLLLSTKDLALVGLSSSNAADVDLARFLASGVTDMQIEVPHGWSFFSWLCW